jgi:hypothetical protein
VLTARFPGRIAFRAIFGLWLLGTGVVNAQTCHTNAPRYDLQDDIVSWSMTIANGRSCLRGTRFANIQFGGLKLVSSPQFGKVALQGAGFIYAPKADFHGRDVFSLMIIGVVNGQPGSSTVQVIVSDGSRVEPLQILPPRPLPLPHLPKGQRFLVQMSFWRLPPRMMLP